VIVIYKTEHTYTRDKFEEDNGNTTTRGLAQTSLNTTPRLTTTQGGSGLDYDKQQRLTAFNQIVSKVKKSREANEILGISDC